MKQLFEKVIMNEIENEELRNFALYSANEIPNYFWEIPASSSGKYHPITDLGEGGLVRHSLMVCKVAIDLLNSSTSQEIINLKDPILFACLFHDCCKNGIVKSNHTEHIHPLIAKGFIGKCSKEYAKNNKCSTLFFSLCSDIQNMISTHMGRWNKSKYSPIELPTPDSIQEKFVHQCDYIASRKYCLFDEEFFSQY